MAGLFETRTDLVVRSGLDGLAARHRAYANNIANLETPGFHPSEVPFEAQLRQIRDRVQEDPSQIDRIQSISVEPVMDDQGADRVDGNGVQADVQVTRLAESTLTYEALAQAAKMRGALLRSVLTDGRQ